MTALGRYVEALSVPTVFRLLCSAAAARLALALQLVVITLFVQECTDSYAIAGLTTGAYSIGNALGTPYQGRLVDRHGTTPVMWPLALLHTAAVIGLVVAGLTAPNAALLLACGLLAGLAVPPCSAVARRRISEAVTGHPSLMPVVFAVDALVGELVFIVGPMLAAVVVALASTSAALIGSALVCVASVAALTTTPGELARTPVAERHLLGALRSRGIRTIVLMTLPIGAGYGTLQIAIIAFTEEIDMLSSAPVLLGTLSIGGAVGAITYGALGHRVNELTSLLAFTLAIPVLLVPLLFAQTFVAMAALLMIAGVALSPVLAILYQSVANVAPPDAVTEAFSWPFMATGIGIAAGLVLSGPLVDELGSQAAFVAAIVSTALTATVAVTRRWTLAERPGSPGPQPLAEPV